jgi:hypothetical protein
VWNNSSNDNNNNTSNRSNSRKSHNSNNTISSNSHAYTAQLTYQRVEARRRPMYQG